MINTLTRAVALGAVMTAAIFAGAAPAFSQAPSEAQREAIKSECRSDYMAHCSSIPPGGEASLQCLQKNMSSLAPGCQSAVKAVEAPARVCASDREAGRRDRGQACRGGAEGNRVEACSQHGHEAADQCADLGDPQRLSR